VKTQRPTHHTRAARARRDFWKRFGVWIFIVFFALSVAGGLIVVGSELTSRH
jgi:ABC-type microcin C transport system permease subunit YejE